MSPYGQRGARWLLLAVAGVVCLLQGADAQTPLPSSQPSNSCLDCHAEFPEPLGVSRENFNADIHAQKGLTCAACHGGNPAQPAPELSMSRAAGFRGHVERKQIPALCSRCHSDAAYMRRYNPSLPPTSSAST